jgi:hypothetical protein
MEGVFSNHFEAGAIKQVGVQRTDRSRWDDLICPAAQECE